MTFADPSERVRPQFSGLFMDRHAGSIVRDPHIALVELVANCWDAGATAVHISWPTTADGEIVVMDNGVGMTDEQFRHRWMTLNYDRTAEQGLFVDTTTSRRRAFGRNGIGRHAPFCFADSYVVESQHKDDDPIAYRVTKADGDTPFNLSRLSHISEREPGTIIKLSTENRLLSIEDVRHLLGTRFVASPEFSISLNSSPIGRAHARTFRLLRRMEDRIGRPRDAELASVLEEGEDRNLFERDDLTT